MRNVNTAQISTGNVRTTVDTVQYNPLGTRFDDNANGVAYRYVKYNSTAKPAVQAAPAVVFWKDAAKTTVTGKLSESYNGKSSSCAGILMPNSTDIATLTAAILQDTYVWICVAGVVAGVTSAAAAAGDALMATQADWTTTGGFSKVADGAAPTNRVVAYALAASAAAVDVVVETL